MDKRNIFVALLKYDAPAEKIDSLLAEHRAFLDRYIATGHLIVCGRQNPPTGGVIIGYADSREEMERILKEDPFYTSGIATHTITEFSPTKWRPSFESI